MIVCENLVKIYKTEDIEVVALQGLDLSVEKGELMAIIGNSGSGKSTLLNILGALDQPSAGRLYIDGKDISKFNRNQMLEYKQKTVGFVWQNNARNLIPYLTALENIELVMMLAGKVSRKRAEVLLELVGLSHRKNSRLFQLSGGEQQRVAIAIALANDPKILLADEPTGAVDTKTSAHILEIFRMLNEKFDLTVVIVTHDRQLSRLVDRVVAIRDGRTSSEFIRKKSYTEELAEIKDGLSSVSNEESHIELAVLDKAGRLQIPREYIEALDIKNKNKLKVELKGKSIVLLPPE